MLDFLEKDFGFLVTDLVQPFLKLLGISSLDVDNVDSLPFSDSSCFGEIGIPIYSSEVNVRMPIFTDNVVEESSSSCTGASSGGEELITS